MVKEIRLKTGILRVDEDVADFLARWDVREHGRKNSPWVSVPFGHGETGEGIRD